MTIVAVFGHSEHYKKDHSFIRFNFSEGVSLDGLVESMLTTGFQATNVGLAIEEINRMVR